MCETIQTQIDICTRQLVDSFKTDDLVDETAKAVTYALWVRRFNVNDDGGDSVPKYEVFEGSDFSAIPCSDETHRSVMLVVSDGKKSLGKNIGVVSSEGTVLDREDLNRLAQMALENDNLWLNTIAGLAALDLPKPAKPE